LVLLQSPPQIYNNVNRLPPSSTHAEMNSLYRFEAGSEPKEGQQQQEQQEERQ
jgi:hypothetical protein